VPRMAPGFARPREPPPRCAAAGVESPAAALREQLCVERQRRDELAEELCRLERGARCMEGEVRRMHAENGALMESLFGGGCSYGVHGGVNSAETYGGISLDVALRSATEYGSGCDCEGARLGSCEGSLQAPAPFGLRDLADLAQGRSLVVGTSPRPTSPVRSRRPSEAILLAQDLKAELQQLRQDGAEMCALATRREVELRAKLTHAEARQHEEACIARRFRDEALEKVAVAKRGLDASIDECAAAHASGGEQDAQMRRFVTAAADDAAGPVHA